MNKINCDIIKDLLPIYVDKLTSNESNKIIEEHLNNCNECKQVYEQMITPIETEQTQNQNKEINFLKKVRAKTIKTFVIGFTALIIIFGILTWIFLIGTRAKADDVTITTTINEFNTTIDEGNFRIELTNGKRLEVKTRPIYGEAETVIGYVITPYSILKFPGKDCNNYTIGYPLTSDYTITVRFKDKDVVYSMRDKELVELK